MLATSTEFANGAIVGGRPIDATVAPTEAHDVKEFLRTSVVLPPDSDIIAPVSVRSPSGIRPGLCSLVEPSGRVTEDYGLVVGRTLVDATSWSAGVLMVNPNVEEIVLPSFTCVGVPVSAVSVALADPELRGEECETLPDHLEDIVMGSHPSLGRLVVVCFGTFSIGMNMCFRRPGNLSWGVLHQFSMKS